MNSIFGKNLGAIRTAKGWTQQKAADELEVNRSTYAAWEEGRGFPTAEMLVHVARVFKITDLIGMIENESFNYSQQIPKVIHEPTPTTTIEKAYQAAGIREKLAVNILLGLVDLS